MTQLNEIERISSPKHGSWSDELICSVFVECPLDAEIVLNKCREVLMIVLTGDLNIGDDLNSWRDVLPFWFSSELEPEMTTDVADAIRRSPDGFDKLSKMWTLSGFLYWFEPANRDWFWWDIGETNSRNFEIQLLVNGFPFSFGALAWLIKVAGGTEIRLE